MLPLGQREKGLFSGPDASGGLKGSGASGDISMLSQPVPSPSPSPVEFLKWAGSAVFKGGLAESILLVFQSGSLQKGIIMAGVINLLVNQFVFFY